MADQCWRGECFRECYYPETCDQRPPVAASDARPPSDTGTTGWHMPKDETADDLRWYATHEALARHSIFDVLQHVADLMETHTLAALGGQEGGQP